MKRILITLSLVLSFTLFSLGQKEHNIWYFGDQNGIDFNNGAPAPLSDGQIITFEAAATVCDAEGNLLFYSNGGGRDVSFPDGITTGLIYNKDHQILYDMGNEEGGGFSARQGALIIPKPETPGEYYLFTMEELEFYQAGDIPSQPQGRGLSYFEIDMSLNGGLGGVTIADERIQVPLYEGLSGTLHANGVDYWIMIADLGYPDNAGQINNFGVLEVTADGVGDIVWTDVGSFYLLNPTTEFSPDGKYFLSTRKLFSFDNATGAIQDLNIQFDPGGVPAAYGFSPNSRYAYYLMWAFQTETLTVSRYDLEASDILGSEEIIGTIPNTFQSSQMQIGPDGNLYFAHFGGGVSNSRISRIRCPNTDNPTIEESIFTFGWNDFPLYFSMGNYTDHVFKSEQDFTLNICPGDTTTLCAGTLDLSVAIEDGTYLWSTGETTAEITVDAPGTYTLVANSFCGTASDTVVVLGPGATVEIVGDPSFCAGANTTLSLAGDGNYTSILWSTGETTESIIVDEAATYTVTVTDICDFTYDASIDISLEAAPVVNSILMSEEPCEGKTISLSPEYTGTALSFLWSTGETTESIEIDMADLYTVEVINDCGSASAELEPAFGPCACDFSLPSAFSPNNDGVNDVFGLVFPCELIQSYELRIYNRWGQEVFFSDNPAVGWTGLVQEDIGPSDVYAWKLKYQEIEKEETLIQGELTLLR